MRKYFLRNDQYGSVMTQLQSLGYNLIIIMRIKLDKQKFYSTKNAKIRPFFCFGFIRYFLGAENVS